MSGSNFDPSKATIGVWSRKSWNGAIRRPEELDSNPMWDMDPYDYEPPETEKLAEMPVPPDTELPHFPEPRPGGPDEPMGPPGPTDLHVHGSHEIPKPSTKQLISERLKNLKVQVQGGQKEVVQAKEEQQKDQFRESQSYDTDVDVDRRQVDPPPSWRKIASSAFAVLEDEDVNPIKLMLVLDQQWGEEWRDWEPETIEQTARHDGVTIARTNWDKLFSIKVLTKRDDFWTDPNVFSKVCLAFANRQVDWGFIQQPRTHEIAACVALVERYLREREFSDSVAAYVAASAVRDGYILLPPVLSFAEFPFSQELAMNVGDDIIAMQGRLMQALNEEDKSILETDEAVQYMRLLRCQYHTQEIIDQARS